MPPSRPEALLDACRSSAQSRGFRLFGVVRAASFDRCQPSGARVRDLRPTAGTVLVLAHGGPEGWEAMVAQTGRKPGPPRRRSHPIDAFSRRTAGELESLLREGGLGCHTVLPSDRRTVNFLQLGEEAGFGTISPAIGLLIHPRYGPWVSLRAAVLVDGEPFGPRGWSRSIANDYQPCANCARPCLSACHADAFSGSGCGPRIERCATHRHAGGCADGCDVRRACPVGADQRYGAEEEAFRHQYSLFEIRRYLGLGGWRYVPGFLRPYV